jgi:predicted DsbA family dithiol-disulfide isomerase
MRPSLNVEIYSDVVCPWCYIGKRRFEAAMQQVADEIDVNVVYRPYQLDPTALPGKSAPVIEAYAKKFGGPQRAEEIIAHVTSVAAADGIEFRMDRALRANTLLAHRLLELAHTQGLQVQLKERLLQAYFTDGLDIADAGVLARCAGEVGMDESSCRSYLDGDGGLAEVRERLVEAAAHGISAVPTFVFEEAWSVPGAQDVDVFVQVLRRMAARQSDPAGESGADGD